MLRRPHPRHLPILSVGVEGPRGSYVVPSRLDSGSDDTIFPLWLASRIGIDLSGATMAESQGVGGATLSYWCAPVILRISDGKESCIWRAIVGFIDIRRRTGLLGLAGFLDYFDTSLMGAAREVQLSPNGAFPGHTSSTEPPLRERAAAKDMPAPAPSPPSRSPPSR